MSSSLTHYFSQLGTACDQGWHRFWFTPAPPEPLARLRLVVGCFSLYLVLAFTPDLTTWFASDGLLPRDTVSRLVTGFGQETVYRFSLFQGSDSPAFLWTVHGLFAVNAVLLILGIQARLTAVINLIGLLSYIHRGPMLTGPFEAVLSMLAAYLCLGPSGRALTIWRPRQASPASDAPRPSLAGNISLRLMQVHLAALHLMIGLNMLGGESWWTGDSIWWLLARPESRLFDLTGLLAGDVGLLLVNLLAHLVVAYHLSFSVLIWPRITRPLLVLLAIPFWLVLLLVSGQVSYCLLMLAANLAFVPGSSLSSLWAGQEA